MTREHDPVVWALYDAEGKLAGILPDRAELERDATGKRFRPRYTLVTYREVAEYVVEVKEL